jgi:hypothetical protein
MVPKTLEFRQLADQVFERICEFVQYESPLLRVRIQVKLCREGKV